MTTDAFLTALERAWRPARVIGALGGASELELCDHAAGFIPAAFHVGVSVRGLDIGTGVGVPGLVLAQLLPHSTWTLVDSNERRCEIARRAVESVGLADRVEVIHGRAEDLAHMDDHRRFYDLVVSRLFGQAAETAECGLPFVRVGGSLVVSCSEDSLRRWTEGRWDSLGGCFGSSWETAEGWFVAMDGVAGLEDRFPRRLAARRRSPFSAI